MNDQFVPTDNNLPPQYPIAFKTKLTKPCLYSLTFFTMFFLGAGITYVFTVNSQKRHSYQPSPTLLPTASIASEHLPMVNEEETLTPELARQILPLEESINWQTYNNTKYHYQISVPSSWEITPYSEIPEQADQVNFYRANDTAIRLSVLQNKENLTLREFLVKKIFYHTDIEQETPEQIKIKAELTVDSMVKITVNGKEALTFENKEQTYVKVENLIFAITLSSYETGEKYKNNIIPFFDQILSTFRFLE